MQQSYQEYILVKQPIVDYSSLVSAHNHHLHAVGNVGLRVTWSTWQHSAAVRFQEHVPVIATIDLYVRLNEKEKRTVTRKILLQQVWE